MEEHFNDRRRRTCLLELVYAEVGVQPKVVDMGEHADSHILRFPTRGIDVGIVPVLYTKRWNVPPGVEEDWAPSPGE